MNSKLWQLWLDVHQCQVWISYTISISKLVLVTSLKNIEISFNIPNNILPRLCVDNKLQRIEVGLGLHSLGFLYYNIFHVMNAYKCIKLSVWEKT